MKLPPEEGGIHYQSEVFYDPFVPYTAAVYTTLVCFILYSLVHYLMMLKICKDNGIEQSFNSIAILGASLCIVLSIVSTYLYGFTTLRYAVVILIIIYNESE